MLTGDVAYVSEKTTKLLFVSCIGQKELEVTLKPDKYGTEMAI